MKKKELKSLELKKKTISTFEANNVNGGLTPTISWYICTTIDHTFSFECVDW